MKLLTAILETGPRRWMDFFLAAVPVDICNVATWLETTYPTGTQLSDHRFILDPPFDAFWMEYDDHRQRTGFVFEASEFAQNRTMLAYGFKDSPPSKLGAMLIGAPENGSTPVCRYVLCDESEQPPSPADYERLVHALIPCLFAITFFHCRNVQIQTAPLLMSRPERRRLERAGVVAPPSVRRILIHAGKTLLYDIPSAAPNGSGRRAHIVRGHFKHYGDKFGTSKLFGQIEGTYFWAPHIAGVGAPTNKAEYKVMEPVEGDAH